MPAANDVGDVIAVLRELRRGPVTVAQIATSVGLSPAAAYRLIGKLEAAGAPLVKTRAEYDGRGMPPAEYKITVDGLREWIG